MSDTQVLTRREARAQQELLEASFMPPPSTFGGGFGAGAFGNGIEIDPEPDWPEMTEVLAVQEEEIQPDAQEQWGEDEPFLMGDEPDLEPALIEEDTSVEEPVFESEPQALDEVDDQGQWDAEPATEMLLIPSDYGLDEFPESFVEKVVDSLDVERAVPASFDELVTGVPHDEDDPSWHQQHSVAARPWWDAVVPVVAVIFWVLLVATGLGAVWMFYTGEAIPFLPAELGESLLGLVGK